MVEGMIGPALALLLVLASDAWVLWDAATMRSRRTEVVLTFGSLRLDRPEHWLTACLLVWPIAFPLYIVARGHA